MSDLKIINLKTNKNLKKNKLSKNEIKELFTDIVFENLLGIKVILRDYKLFNNSSDEIEVLGYDENNQLVIIEFRNNRYSGMLKKELFFIDEIKNNVGRIKTILFEHLQYDEVNKLMFNPRIIVIGEDFDHYDEKAIKLLPFSIDLIKFQSFDKNYMIVEKLYQSKEIVSVIDKPSSIDKADPIIYKYISENLRSLGDEVCEVNFNNIIYYRRIKNFLKLKYNDSYEVELGNSLKTIKIKKISDFDKIQREIEKCYDEC